MIRYTVHFSGRVQGVGFRYATVGVAAVHPVAGYVRNLPDGRVQMVAEGEAEAIDRLVTAVQERMTGNVDDTQIVRGAATGEFGRPGIDRLEVRP